MRPLIYLTLFILYTFTVLGQSVKEQIGTSIWTKDGVVFADSAVSYIISYDQKMRRIKEWQVFRNKSGEIKDTEYVDLDKFERLVHHYFGKEHWYYEYDSLGTTIKIIRHLPKDTYTYVYSPIYNDKMRLIKTNITFNEVHNIAPTLYEYKGRTTIENQAGGILIKITKKDNNNKIVYIKTTTNLEEDKSTEIIKYKRDSKGNVLLYTKRINGELIKRTTHYFKRGVEQYQVEQFYNPNYTITTTFRYEYW